jgi:hypothetical protein
MHRRHTQSDFHSCRDSFRSQTMNRQMILRFRNQLAIHFPRSPCKCSPATGTADPSSVPPLPVKGGAGGGFDGFRFFHNVQPLTLSLGARASRPRSQRWERIVSAPRDSPDGHAIASPLPIPYSSR